MPLSAEAWRAPFCKRGKIELHHPRILGDGAVNRGQPRGSGAMERDINLRLQGEDGGVGRVAEADGGSVGLGKAELNFFLGERVPGLLVKEQVRGGEVDWDFSAPWALPGRDE